MATAGSPAAQSGEVGDLDLEASEVGVACHGEQGGERVMPRNTSSGRSDKRSRLKSELQRRETVPGWATSAVDPRSSAAARV